MATLSRVANKRIHLNEVLRSLDLSDGANLNVDKSERSWDT